MSTQPLAQVECGTDIVAAYAKFVSHWRIYQPVSGKYDVGLRRHRLWQLKKQTGSLREALRRGKDDFVEILWEGAERSTLVELLWRRQRVDQVRHGSECAERETDRDN